MKKVTKFEADYAESPLKHQGRCRDCTMFRPLFKICTYVQGTIEPDAHCKFFKKKS